MSSVIVVNPQLEYWGEVSLRKAVNKIVKKKAEVIAHTNQIIGYDSDNQPIYYPLIIQLTRLVIVKWRSSKVHFSHSAVFDRDDNVCQYWHTTREDEWGNRIDCDPYIYKCNDLNRTIDHVIPVSRDGLKNSFRNTVCACRYCNEILKRNRTPEEAGLKLIRIPVEPKRKVGDMMIKRFAYNPTKPSHKAFAKIRPDLI